MKKEKPHPLLGSLASWIRDAILTGILMPPAAVIAMVSLFTLSGTQFNFQIEEFLYLIAVFSAIGAVFGLLVAPIALFAARLTWSSPLLSFGIGPAVGALCAWSFLHIVARIVGDSGTLSPVESLIVFGYGAFALGPPWVAYLAVRARDRSGLGIAIASSIWATAALLLLFLLRWLQLRFGFAP